MKPHPKPRVRPDRAAQPAKAGEARAVEGNRLVLPRYSSCGKTVLRRSGQRYVVTRVCQCESYTAALLLARTLNREDRLCAAMPALRSGVRDWQNRAISLSLALSELVAALDLEEIRPYKGGKLYFALREARRLVGENKETPNA